MNLRIDIEQLENEKEIKMQKEVLEQGEAVETSKKLREEMEKEVKELSDEKEWRNSWGE